MENRPFPAFVDSSCAENLNGISVMENAFNEYPLHRHGFYEFDYILEGEVLSIVNGSERILSAGDAIFSLPVDLHSYKSLNDQKVRVISVHFTNINLSMKINFIGENACVIHCNSDLRQAFLDLNKEFLSNEDNYSYRMLENLLERTILLFSRHTKYVCHCAYPMDITYAMSYIYNNFLSDITLNEISKKCGYSSSYFCSRFKKYVGKSFVEFLNDIRLNYSESILKSQDISIVDLCYECGFNNVRNFRKMFMKKFGCSPTKIKKII